MKRKNFWMAHFDTRYIIYGYCYYLIRPTFVEEGFASSINMFIRNYIIMYDLNVISEVNMLAFAKLENFLNI